MENALNNFINKKELMDFREFVSLLSGHGGKFLLRNDLILVYHRFCDMKEKQGRAREESSIFSFIKKVQEIIIRENYIVIMHRYAIARYRFYLLRKDGDFMEEIDLDTYQDLKDATFMHGRGDGRALPIDFMPFYDYSPSLKDPKAIGNGIRYLNRYMSSSIFSRPEEWNTKLFEFVKLHRYEHLQLLVNGEVIGTFQELYDALYRIVDWLGTRNPKAPYRSVQSAMRRAGFEPGWGNTVGRILETMQLFIDLINEPTDSGLEEFISRVPMPLISKIAIISPHGWFGQENVLGRPDTGGQVIYIIDQVKALERFLTDSIALTGLEVRPRIVVLTRLIPEAGDTTCNMEREKIYHTENCWILRIPFRDRNHGTLQHWISRFRVWPYLERFAEDAVPLLLSEFSGKPDLLIGNYSDGNMVATLLSDRLDVIQCTIAHALEKTKYLFSDLYWERNEKDYHFSLQFMADMLSMNKSDFVITSTYQEIAGTGDTMGQYEAYQFFTMPELCQVRSGINLFSPKFNVIPPGVDEDIYFPFTEKDRRIDSRTEYWERRLFTAEEDEIVGRLESPGRIPIFTMARLDKIKNITGLIEAFGMSALLRKECNLIIVAGTTRIEESSDAEEQDEIRRVYGLIESFGLEGNIRWLPSINKLDTGEVYRVVADKRGIFVQPALFEAFGLTILEAMLSGLPTFGPVFGGPQEIIEYGISGYLLNTSSPDLISASLEKFIRSSLKDPSLWDGISGKGIERVREHFTWKLYSARLINLAKLYGFWRYSVSGKAKIKMDRYCDFIYHFLFRERARMMEDG